MIDLLVIKDWVENLVVKWVPTTLSGIQIDLSSAKSACIWALWEY